jgi:arylsulfatase A-like enzyme
MPFPRVKGQIYEEGCRVGFAVRWGDRIKPGRVVEDFINFPDIAPTIMEAAGLEPHPQMTGRSFLELLVSDKSGYLDNSRNYSLLGREGHDPGRDDGEKIAVGYPVRAIRTKDFLYVVNYEPQRWPEGNPEHNYPECPNGPSKEYLVDVSKDPMHNDFIYYERCLGFRDREELYDMTSDRDCIHNLAGNPAYKDIKLKLAETLRQELIKQKDPRALGRGEVFDTYYYMNFRKLKRMYGDRFHIPGHLEKYTEVSGGKAD